MVSQSQDGVAWDGNGSPSRTGSLLSLDGRQRPTPAKTPPSYYDAVRSRHSLSQPRPSENAGKDAKCANGQQVKYNSLPRPLPQRYPPALSSANGHHPPSARPWPADGRGPTPNPPWRPPAGELPQPRQLYESPPKPANHVPLQLRVHDGSGRFAARQPAESRACAPGRRGGQDLPKPNGAPRPDRPAADEYGARGNSADIPRKNSFRSLPMSLDGRNQPAVPPGRNMHPRSPSLKEPNTNSLPRRDSGRLSDGHRYAMPPDGSPAAHPSYPPRPPTNGHHPYEPRYSKSGKLARPLSQGFESKPMPPPIPQLRTGPLGSYPDPETLRRAEYACRSQEERLLARATSHGNVPHGDASHQIYVDTAPFANGKQPAVTDHLAIPYRIPQVSPTDERGYSACNGAGRRKEVPNGVRAQPPQQLNGNQQQFPRQYQDANAAKFGANGHGGSQQLQYRGYGKPSTPADGSGPFADDAAIYANHDVSLMSGGGHSDHPRNGQRRSPHAANGATHHSPQNGYQNGAPDALYANQPVTGGRYRASPQDNLPSPPPFHHQNGPHGYRDPQKAYPPPPAPPKQRPALPQPSEMVMVTETRGWNGHATSYQKDLVKPTPRLPRFAPNVASGTQMTAVPAYQSVINELSSQNGRQQSSLPNSSSDSSTLSLRSGYDSSSSSSVRDFGRQPSKSDSSLELRKSSEGGLKTAGSQKCIDKTFLSASLTSLCSDTSSSISNRKYSRYHHEDPNWDRMTEEFQKRKEKGSVFIASPWEREEKEKMQQEQLLGARRARDKEIAMLEAIPDRNEKQEEWLRILRLEREFQRRAEQELNDDDEEEEDEEADASREKSEKVESFHGDKMNAIPNERLGLKLLDQLLEDSSKSLDSSREFARSPSEKHFIPLELTIPDRDLLPSTALPAGSNILQVSDPNNSSRMPNKPPVPAPRPSKVPTSYKSELSVGELNQDALQYRDVRRADGALCSLSNLEISNGGVCYNENSGGSPARDYLQDSWMIEVNSFDSRPADDGQPRIYENVAEYPPRQHSQAPPYAVHTLPKAAPKDASPARSSGLFEKRFPAMGVSSTLSRKLNGHAPSDADILPALYASSKMRPSSREQQLPSELEAESPEFRKIWATRPEKLTFQDKIRKFSLQAGEDDAPRDRVKNSRAQREIETKFSDGQRRNQDAAHN